MNSLFEEGLEALEEQQAEEENWESYRDACRRDNPDATDKDIREWYEDHLEEMNREYSL